MAKRVVARKEIPFEFVLEQLEPLGVHTKFMFGCTAIYEGNRLLVILRDREDHPDANGIWLATFIEHHESLKREFPTMKDIPIFGPGPMNWQVLPSSEPDFEEKALLVCELCLARDPRIGKVPATRLKKSKSANGKDEKKRATKKNTKKTEVKKSKTKSAKTTAKKAAPRKAKPQKRPSTAAASTKGKTTTRTRAAR